MVFLGNHPQDTEQSSEPLIARLGTAGSLPTPHPHGNFHLIAHFHPSFPPARCEQPHPQENQRPSLAPGWPGCGRREWEAGFPPLREKRWGGKEGVSSIPRRKHCPEHSPSPTEDRHLLFPFPLGEAAASPLLSSLPVAAAPTSWGFVLGLPSGVLWRRKKKSPEGSSRLSSVQSSLIFSWALTPWSWADAGPCRADWKLQIRSGLGLSGLLPAAHGAPSTNSPTKPGVLIKIKLVLHKEEPACTFCARCQ